MPKLRRFKGVKGPPGLIRERDLLGEPIPLTKSKTGPKPVKTRSGIVDRTDSEVGDLLRKWGDNSMEAVTKARRVLGIMRQEPNYSDIEAVGVEYCRRKGIEYQTQISVFGGRNAPAGSGGAVLDLVIRNGGAWIAIEINGMRWHSRTMSGQEDFFGRVRLTGYNHFGMVISDVISVWEDSVWATGDAVWDAAVVGIEYYPNRRVLSG